MALTFTEKTGNYDNVDRTTYTTASVTPAANKLLVIDIAVSGTNPVVTAVAWSGGGAAWVLEKEDNGSGRAVSRWRYSNASPPAANTIDITVGGTGITGGAWTVVEVDGQDTSGTNGSGAFVQSVSAFSTGTSGNATLAPYTGADSRPLASIGVAGNVAITPELTGGTNRLGGSPASSHLSEWSTSTQDTTPSFSWAGSNTWRSIASEIKMAVASGPQTVNPTGIASAEAFGTAQVNMNVPVTGIASGEAFGTVTIQKDRLLQNFEGGSNGTTITAANSGPAIQEDPFDAPVIGGISTLTFDNAHAAHGTLAAKVAAASGQDDYLPWSTLFGTRTEIWGRLYVYLTANPAVTARVFRARDGASLSAAFNIDAAGRLTLHDSAGTLQGSSVASVALNQWVRLEFHIIFSATVGFVEVKMFNTPDGTTPTETASTAANLNTRTQATAYHYGVMAQGANAETIWLDDLGLNAVGYPGPWVQTSSPGGIASAEAFGTLQVNLNVSPTGIASAEAFGTLQANLTIFPAGVVSGEAFGTLKVNLTIYPSGVASGEAFGNVIVSVTGGPQTVVPIGIASGEAFGTVKVSLNVSPTGIASAEAFGTLKVNLTIFPSGIASAEAFGSPGVGAVTFAAVRIYGKTGTFYTLTGDTVLGTEQTFDQVGIGSWATRPGKSLGWSAVADGKVFMAGQDLGGNPTVPTGTEMVFSILDPTTLNLTNVIVPTTHGDTSVLVPGGTTGGAVLNDVEAVEVAGETYVAFVSTFPYHEWKIGGTGAKGLYPTLVIARKIAGTWQYDATKSKTADQLRDSSAAGALAFPNSVNAFGETYASGQGIAEIVTLPGTSIIVGTQYFNDWRATKKAGSLFAVDVATGVVKAYWEHPYEGDDPTVTDMGMRAILVDPSATGTLKRFVVIFDCYRSGASAGFDVAQEFTYDTLTDTFAPASVPFRTDEAGRKWGNGTIDSDGGLWFVEEAQNFQSGDTCIWPYPRRTLTLEPEGEWWKPNGKTGTEALPFPEMPPDLRYTPPSGTQIPWGRPLEDPITRTVFWHSLNAKIVAFHRSAGDFIKYLPLPHLDLDYKNQIESQEAVGVRGRLVPSDGSVDVANRYAWYPIAQIDSSNTVGTPAPHSLDNWMYRLDLDRLFRLPVFGRARAKEHWLATDITPILPDDWESGDFMLFFAVLIGGGESRTLSTPVGWTKDLDLVRVAGSFGHHVALFSKVMDEDDVAPTTVITGGTINTGWITAWFRGARPGVQAISSMVHDPATSAYRPALVLTLAENRIIGFYGSDGSVTFSNLSGEISRASDSGGGIGASELMTDEELLVGPSTASARSVTISASKQTAGATVALAPMLPTSRAEVALEDHPALDVRLSTREALSVYLTDRAAELVGVEG